MMMLTGRPELDAAAAAAAALPGEVAEGVPTCLSWALAEPSTRERGLKRLRELVLELDAEVAEHVVIEEECVASVSLARGLEIRRRLALTGVVPKALESRVQRAREAAKAFVVDLQLDELHVALCPGEKAAADAGDVVDSHGVRQRLFAAPRKGRAMAVLFVGEDSGMALEPLLRLSQVVRSAERLCGVAITVAARPASALAQAGDGIEHLWSGEDAWAAQVVQSFGVRSLPYCVVLDRHRVVRWRGHPGAGGMDEAIRAACGSLQDTDVAQDAAAAPPLGEESPNTEVHAAEERAWERLGEQAQAQALQKAQHLMERHGLAEVEFLVETSRRWPCAPGSPAADTHMVLHGRASHESSFGLASLRAALPPRCLDRVEVAPCHSRCPTGAEHRPGAHVGTGRHGDWQGLGTRLRGPP